MTNERTGQCAWLTVLLVGSFLAVGAVAPLAWAGTPVPTPVPTVDPVPDALTTVDAKLATFATQDARSAINPIAAKAKTDARVAAGLGRVLDQERKYDDAIAQLKQATALDPGNPAYLVSLGEIYVRQRRDADANATFQKLNDLEQPKVDADATQWEPRYYLSIAQMRLKQLDKAADGFQKALVLKPGDAMTLYYFGYCRALQQKWADAVDKLTQALAANPTLAYAYYYRGMAQDKLGKKDQLVLDMNAFVKLAPNTPEAERAKSILDAAKR
jgi:tetratricopeptide (TPR) repeat protein